DLAPFAELTPEALRSDARLFEPEPEIRWIADDRTNYASANFEGESEDPGAALYYWLGDDADDVSLTVYQGHVPVSVLEASGAAGLHKVQWDLTRRIERSAEEQERMREELEEGGGGFFRRGGPSREERIRYEMSDAPPGEYRVVLVVGGAEHARTLTVMKDEWWEERR
ncbi:MAG: hypothetical protein R3266_13835, partial [Gemmatimonadota bacterium]|nr:hypothetical protein [Gemmatimonadota bacterium]